MNNNDNNPASAGATDQHHPLPSSCSASAACLPLAPSVIGGGTDEKVPSASSSSSCSASSVVHAVLSSPCAVGTVVALVGLVVLLVSALSSSSPSPTTTPTFAAGIGGPNQHQPGPTASVGTVQYAAGTPLQPSPFATVVVGSPTAAGRFVGTADQQKEQQQQQIDTLRARLDQLQYELAQLQYTTTTNTASASSWQEPAPVWPPSFYAVNHPKALLTRRHMAWQPMRRGIENDEHSNVVPRHISWQPMKRQQTEYGSDVTEQYGRGGGGDSTILVNGGGQKEQLMRTVEQKLIEVIKAGDRLGVSADEILAHLRTEKGNAGDGGAIGGR